MVWLVIWKMRLRFQSTSQFSDAELASNNFYIITRLKFFDQVQRLIGAGLMLKHLLIYRSQTCWVMYQGMIKIFFWCGMWPIRSKSDKLNFSSLVSSLSYYNTYLHEMRMLHALNAVHNLCFPNSWIGCSFFKKTLILNDTYILQTCMDKAFKNALFKTYISPMSKQVKVFGEVPH